MNYDISSIETLLIYQNQRLDNLFILGCLIFGSLLFIHFGRFIRW